MIKREEYEGFSKEVEHIEIARALVSEIERMGSIGNYKGIALYVIQISRGGLELENLAEIEKALFYEDL